jgi:putative ABC transport system permease protein
MGRVKILLLRASRQLWAIRYRIAAISFIAASSFAIYTGIYSAIDSLFASRDAYYRLGNIADLELRLVPDDQVNVPSFKSFPGIKAFQTRLLLPGHLTLKNGSKLAATMVGLDLQQANDINKLTILEGQAFDPAKPNEVVIDRNMAAYHGLKIGDHLDLAVGNDSYQLTVRGIGRSSEFLLAAANPNFFIPSKGSMGIIFANLELIKARLGFNLVNSILFKFAPSVTDTAALVEKIKLYAEKKLTIEEVLPKKRQFSYLFMNVDLHAFAIFVPAVIVIFSLAAIIITFFLLFQWVMAQRQEIGLLKALGYEKGRLAIAYSYPVLVMALLAIVFGAGLSYLVLLEFGHSYTQAVGFPKPFLSISPSHAGLAALGAVVGLVVASLWPQARLMSLSPQDAVRAERGNGGKAFGAFFGAISRLIRGRIWLTYPVRNILRSKGISLMTVLSITLAMGVSLSYFIATTSFKDSIVKNFEQDRWQIAVDFLTPVWDDELEGLFGQIKQIKAIDPYIRGGIRIAHNGTRMSSLLGGINPSTSMHHVNMLQGSYLAPGDSDGILLERKLARSLGAGVGDTVTVDSHGHTYQVSVDGVFSGAFPGESYTDLKTARKWMNLDTQLNGVFLQVNGNPKDLVETLNNVKRVAQVTLKSNLAEQVVEVSEEAMVIIYVSAAFSIAVTLLFLFTSATFTVLQRKNEYVLLRIIGFEENTLSLMIFVEVIFLGLIAAVLAVPTGYVIASSLVSKLSDAWFTVSTSMSISDVAFIIGPAILLLPLSAWPVSRLVRSMSPVKTLRERMFG